jgi:low temperature requirement protein LtrA
MSTEPSPRVSTLELFFDLVFVFTITQVTHLVAHAHDALDLVRAFLVLAVTWWMYSGYAWLTNNVDIDANGVRSRLLMLGGMAGFFVMALSIPRVADRDAIAFALAYLVVILVHGGLFTQAPNAPARAIVRVASFNVALALVVLAAGVVPARWNVLVWIGAGLLLAGMSVGGLEAGFPVRAGHFAERHGLVILIALGESVIGIGTGAEDIPVRLPLVTAAVLGLALAASLWWSYFDRDDVRGEHALASADERQRARLGVRAYWYAHLAMISGIVVAAAGVNGVVADLTKESAGGAAWLLSIGVAVYLVGEAAFRWMLRIGPARVALVAAALVLATGPVGLAAGSLAQLGLMVAVLVAMLVVERRLVARRATPNAE